jgi:serine/threonine-protein kinase RsbW
MHRRILIMDTNDDLGSALGEVFVATGHAVDIIKNWSEEGVQGQEQYDIVIMDAENYRTGSNTGTNGHGAALRPETPSGHPGGQEVEHVKAFKISAGNFRRDEFDEEELKSFVATTLDYKIRFVDKREVVQDLHESIQFELPSAISLMHIVLEYLMKRVEKLGVVKPEQSNLFVALDEAFVNAVKHGNKYDSRKLVKIKADVSRHEARFTIEDEGDGFDINSIPDPLDPENLFKSSGRGVLFIYNIMDEVNYNERGNQLTMVKRSAPDPVKK